MKTYGILIDTTSTIDQKFIKDNNIELVFNSVNDDQGNIFIDKCTDKQKLEICELVAKENRAIRTSSVNQHIFQDKFKEMLKNYEKVIYLSIAPTFSGQYSNALTARKELKEAKDKIVIVHSFSTACQTEIILNWLLSYLKTNKLDEAKIQKEIEGLNQRITTMFTCCNFEGMTVTGRIPKIVAKTLKLTKFFPIIKAEEVNEKFGLYRKWSEGPHKVFEAVDQRFTKPPRAKDIEELYLCQSVCDKARIEELVNLMAKYFDFDKNKIKVRSTPLAVLATTLKDSFGVAILTSKEIKRKAD